MKNNQNTKTAANFPIKPCMMAAFIVATVIINQAENNCVVEFDDIESTFPSMKGTGWRECEEYLDEVVSCMFGYPQFDGGEGSMIELTDEGFDCVAFTNYIACEPCDDDFDEELDDDFDEE